MPVWKKKLTIGGAAPIKSAARPETRTARRPTIVCWKFCEWTPSAQAAAPISSPAERGDQRPGAEAVRQLLQRPPAGQGVHARVERDIGQVPHDHWVPSACLLIVL